MNKKDNSNSKKADFIDLDKKEFKNKNNSFRYFIFFFFFLLLSICFFFLYKVSFSDFTISTASKDNLNKSKIEKRDEFDIEIFKSINTDLKNNQKKLEDLEIRNNDLESKINELENVIEKFINEPVETTIEKLSESEIPAEFRAIYTFERLRDKFFKNEKIDRELKVINNLFASNKTIIAITTSIGKFRNSFFYDQKILLKRLNDIIKLNIVQDDTKISENEKIEIASFRDLFTYLRDLASSIIVIRKIPEKSNLDIYSPVNNRDSKYMNAINNTKDFLIIESYIEALDSIESLNQPLPNNLEEWKKDLVNLISIKNQFEILKKEILLTYEVNDQNP